MNKSSAINEFKRIRDIIYIIPLSSGEDDFCCVGKHILLKKSLEKLGYKVRYRICTFKWSDFHLPEELQEIPHENDCTHLYLEFENNGKWLPLDATWDKELTPVFDINDWDGESGTEILVPALDILSVEESKDIVLSCYDEEVIRKDIENNGDFYKAFNKWLTTLRSQAPTK